MVLGVVDLYGMFGLATADASFDCLTPCGKAKSTLSGLAYGVGAQFLVTKSLKVSLDYMIYNDGSSNFSGLSANVKTSALGLGVNFGF